MKKLLLRFTGVNIPDWLLKEINPNRILQQPEFVRLKTLFNAMVTHMKTTHSSRELDHLVTNMVACLLPGANKILRKGLGRRLILPAVHIILQSALDRTDSIPDAPVSIATFLKYRPWWIINPSPADGLCQHCATRRNLITEIHRSFSETNPDFKCDDLKKKNLSNCICGKRTYRSILLRNY